MTAISSMASASRLAGQPPSAGEQVPSPAGGRGTPEFTSEEIEILERYFTNVDRPVFALTNLPEVVKGALFARYSRSAKSLRRLFLDEFADEVIASRPARTVQAAGEPSRAGDLYQRVFVEYGDDSVAQLGGAHLACEGASNLLTKILERGRLMSYLEQSTRYIDYSSRLPSGGYRYYVPPELSGSSLGEAYRAAMDNAFESYGEMVVKLRSWLEDRVERTSEDSPGAYRRALNALVFDTLRGILPVASLSNVGLYGTGQAYEQLLVRMRSDPLGEARACADAALEELRKVIPAFLRRVDEPGRGEVWRGYRERCRADTMEAAARLLGEDARASAGLAAARSGDSAAFGAPGMADVALPEVLLTDWDPDGELKVLAAALYPVSTLGDSDLQERVRRMGRQERAELMAAYVGDRENRRYRPGRAFERTSYRFEVVADYGAFRDLQRHRILTIDWQPLSAHLGYEIPHLVKEAGLSSDVEAVHGPLAAMHERLGHELPWLAGYALTLSHRIRFVMEMNAREAMHVIELRSGPQGHPSYRRVVQAMHRLIAEQAGHRLIAGAMSHVDHSDEPGRLGRLEAERRAEESAARLP